jgi:hypothetical protein
MSRQTDLLREIAAAMSSGLIGTIAYHDTRTVDQRHDILNDHRVFPSVVSPLQRHFDRYRSALQCVIDRVEHRCERHHYRSQVRLDFSNSAILNTIGWARRGVLWRSRTRNKSMSLMAQ